MADTDKKKAPERSLSIKADDATLKGAYANMLQVSDTAEEFVLDFMLAHPPAGQLVARVITSPGHLKRIIAALQTQLKNHEQRFGNVKAAEAPKEPIGF